MPTNSAEMPGELEWDLYELREDAEHIEEEIVAESIAANELQAAADMLRFAQKILKSRPSPSAVEQEATARSNYYAALERSYLLP